MNLKDKIHTIRNKQVILDKDLAKLYEIETRSLKQSVRRNTKRFSKDFMFQLNDKEIEDMVSQNVIPSKKYLGGSYPYAFTEQGIATLSGILKSKKAIDANIWIMRAFVTMCRFISLNIRVADKFQQIDQKLLEHDKNFEKVFNAMQDKLPEKGIFFDGQVYDAYNFITNLIKQAKKSIILIDNYIDSSILTLFSEKKKDVKVKIYTKNISDKLKLAMDKFNDQYGKLELKEFSRLHDRFLIIDDHVYHFGASLKDIGKKWFGFSKFDKNAIDVLERLR